jgi:hypothetical protein
MSSQGYTSSARVSSAPGAYIQIPAADFGAPAPAAPVGTASGTSGSLSTNAFTKVAWVTSEGISLPSPETETALSADTAVSIAQPPVPVGGATVIGWVIYESATTNTETALKASNESVQTQQVFQTNSGPVTAFPIATTTVVVLKVGTGGSVQLVDQSGIQAAFPSVAANSTADYDAIIPNTGSQWKVQKSVEFMRPSGVAETAGIVLAAGIDCIQPVYPGTSASVSVNAFTVLNGYLFKATTGGTTAATFIGFSKFNTTKGATTTDGSVVWTSYGKAALARFHFGNVSGSAATPAAQEYDLFQS